MHRAAAQAGPDRPQRKDAIVAGPLGALAVRLLAWAREAGPRGLIHVASGERRAEQLVRILSGLAPDLDVVLFPPWDCLPYDRAPPSREVMGRRIAVLSRLARNGDAPRLVATTPAAIVQRVPPRELWAGTGFAIRCGEALAVEDLESFLRRSGYVLDERVDEPGEAAIRGQVIDLFPAGTASPYRLEHSDGRITAIRCYDPVTQRTVAETGELLLQPVSEAVLPEARAGEAEPERVPGMEHWLPDYYPRLETLFDYLPDAAVALDPEAESRRNALAEQIADAYESRTGPRSGLAEALPERTAVPPARLYLDDAEWAARLGERESTMLRDAGVDEASGAAVPRFATSANPARAFAAFIRDRIAAGQRVVLAAVAERDARILARRAEQAAGRSPDRVADWNAVTAAPAGSLLALQLDLDSGFVAEADGATVIAAADLLGSRAAHASDRVATGAVLPIGEIEFRLGDAVVHIDHGMGALRGLETVSVAETAASDTIRLEYAGDAILMAPVEEIGKVWRYGSDAEAVSLDRLDGNAWAARRARVEAELAETARRLVDLARVRHAAAAPKLVPPRRDYERFVARFPYTETPDQARSIEDTLADLASGRPMDRLVCGDVGFGKTEVALRAAAAAALAGKQVAVVAPTTVLARQHVQSFRRRFAGLGVEVAHLSRLVKPSEAGAVKQGLAEGSVRVVVGTHALAAKGVRFRDLGLLIIDEEQRFGARHKAKLRALGRGVHVLTLTATPIPRTLQSAMVGLQELSVIATPPARRQPIRTFLMHFDPVAAREALLRERRRGGQSFVVCPRIEDIEPMAARLREVVPELHVMVAHGRMPAEEIDDVMLRFADGEGDALLATNIIESGLDVPRANTILIWRADRFGLSQLHQLRGRVGRGRLRGVAYLLTDPAARIGAATLKRLRTLEALDRLGAGFEISARDLDLRGAGDLLGEEQAGHVKLIGVGLYQHVLERALRVARGEAPGDDGSPELNLGLSGLIPQDYVPEAEVRINLYARLARLRHSGEIDALADEIEDRFGPLPEAARHLLDLARLRRLCGRLGVAKLDAGPQAVALTFRPGAAEAPGVRRAVERSQGELQWRGERLVFARASETSEQRRDLAAELLDALEEP